MVDTDSWMFSLKTPVGWLLVKGNKYFVTCAEFVFDQPADDYGGGELRERSRRQLQVYLESGEKVLNLPIMTKGSEFQQRLWTALETIPPGETRTYGYLASLLGSSARAVGGACKKNPLAVIVPCHRVVAANGIGGYAGARTGDYLKVKSWLIEHEKQRS